MFGDPSLLTYKPKISKTKIENSEKTLIKYSRNPKKEMTPDP